MAHHIAIETEKSKQREKAVLGLGYLKEGLAPFCDVISKQQQQHILDQIKREEKVSSIICGTCTLKTLQPDHVCLENKRCPLGHVTCNCCYTSGKIACPNNVCGSIYDSIIAFHASTPPAPNWENTQMEHWYADPWSIAKCFINAPGYMEAHSAADTDITGLLQMIINNKYFHNHISCDMTGPNIFSKVSQIKTEIFQSSTMELDGQVTNSYIDAMITILQDSKELIHRHEAQEAVKKLENLKNKDLTMKEVKKVLGNVKEETAIRADEEDYVDLTLQSAKVKNASSDQEEIAHISATTRIPENVTILKKKIHKKVESSPKYRDSLHTPLEELEAISSESYQEKLASTKGFEAEWTTCIRNKDEEKAYQLLEQGHLPDAALLDKACQTLGLKSALLKKICTQIEEKITASSDCIIYTNACYKEKEKNTVVFVVITREATDYEYLSKDKYNLLVRNIDDCSQEGVVVVAKEKDLQFGESELAALEVVLKDNSPGLMANHSNLTLTSGSMFKSKYQGLKEPSTKKNVCIVFYVTVKGLIPLGEDLLPKKLGQFDTDVREGRFAVAVGGQPEDKHSHLKIGCQISIKDSVGTIGGFVNHPKYGICALTCAHVVLSKKEAITLAKTGIVKRKEKECFQPKNNRKKNEDHNRCGTVIEVMLKNGDSPKENVDDPLPTYVNVGVDAALVKIDNDRRPTNGNFPDCNVVSVCSHCNDDTFRKTSSFNNGKVLDTADIKTNRKVIKYGQNTKFTIGNLKVKGGSGTLDLITAEKSRYSNITLHNLILIDGVGCTFSDAGDSGALVFSQDDKNELAAIGLLVGSDNRTTTLVQPICSVLNYLELEKPFSFMNFDP